MSYQVKIEFETGMRMEKRYNIRELRRLIKEEVAEGKERRKYIVPVLPLIIDKTLKDAGLLGQGRVKKFVVEV